MDATEDAVTFIETATWRFASTMPDWPHEYTVRDWRSDLADAFQAFCVLIRTRGVVEAWPPPPANAIYRNRYLVIGGRKYWAMGMRGDRGPIVALTVINRSRLPEVR